MRIGLALDTHATRATAEEVSWPRLLAQAQLAEDLGFDLVVLPDHLLYAAGGEGDYARPDEAVGAWESVTLAGALASSTTRIGVGHSMLNAPYRSPYLVAKAAATLDEVSGGRYQLGIGSGNSFDYAAVGVDADDRSQRLAETVEILHALLREGRADVVGATTRTQRAEMVLPTPQGYGPPLAVAARGPRSMRVAARYADLWNTWVAPDPDHVELAGLLGALDVACAETDRDPATLHRTVDASVDPLDLAGARERCREALLGLTGLGVSEARCYLNTEGTHASRMRALEAMASTVEEAHSS